MRLKFLVFAAAAGAAIVLPQTRLNSLYAQSEARTGTQTGARTGAQASPRVALSGRVSSAQDGPLEGVLVGVKKAGSTITITVVTDEQGWYRFPPSRLEPGSYALRIRAAGYDLVSPETVDVVDGKTTTADLTVAKAKDLASQLSNAEWIQSVPGTVQEKAILRPCSHCHTLERIVRSRHNAEEFVSVIERMSTYPQLSFPLKIQKLPAPRVGPGVVSQEQRLAAWRHQAEYLAKINLSAAP